MSRPVAAEDKDERAEEWVGQPAPPCAMVIFGATGDLTKRKLIPALYNLIAHGLLPEAFAVVGVGRSPLSDDEFRQRMEKDLKEFATEEIDAKKLEVALQPSALRRRRSRKTQDVQGSRRRAAGGRRRAGHGRQLSLLSRGAAQHLRDYVDRLGETGLMKEPEGSWRRVIIEKPFGHDLESAQALNRKIREVLDERQIFRIDHYLGKETVQNIMAFRFANGIFEPIWNRRYIDHVQITVAETVGVEERGGYYEEAGALRDMVQNHMFQLLALIAHGAAGLVRRRRGARRAREGALRDPAADAGGRAAPGRARPVRRGRWMATASACPPTARRKASRRLRTSRPTRRSSCSSTTGAGPTCRSICAPASGCRSGLRRSRSSSSARR